MKIGFDKKKGAEVLAAIAQGTSEVGKKVAEGVKSGTAVAVEKTKTNTAAVIEKSKNDAYSRRLKKYNPLFPDQYSDENFNLPNIIVIVDDAVRKGIDVCEGAIGWLGNENDVEILYLYDEAVPNSGIRFIPTATCDSVYYVDSFDRHSFIKADCYFKKVQDERTAELEHIARCLGAKSCSVEMVEKRTSAQAKKRTAELSEKVGMFKNKERADQSSVNQSASEIRTLNRSQFQGNDVPQKPTLKWFAHEDSILELIAARCNGNNSLTQKDMKFSGTSFATMSKKAACAIDCALATSGSVTGSSSMESQATQEQESQLYFHVEF